MTLLQRTKQFAAIAIATATLSACQLTSTELPAISDTGVKQTGHIVWHDLVTPDLAQSKAFYSAVFNWQFQTVNDSYLFIKANNELIAGMAKLDNSNNPSHWLSLISVNNIDAVVEKTQQAGGDVLIGKTNIVGRGHIAVLQDPQGAVFSVINTNNGDPLKTLANNTWVWQEVWSDNPASSQRFYQSLGSYQIADKTLYGHNYQYLTAANKPAIGFVKKPSDEIGNTWVNYIKVADVDATLLKVTAAGGEVLMAPNEQVRNGTVAIIRDPAGAGLVIQEAL